MRILSLTAGAGRMYCGSCLRDNALARALQTLGHDVTLVPLYTPTRTDDANVSHPQVFFGGISVYLQQRSSLFRHLPKFLDRLWDRPAVIHAFAGRGVQVDPQQLGALTVSMLEGRDGRQRKEFAHLAAWLASQPPPNLATLPYTLLIALAQPLREATRAPVVCWLQGEELFLEGLAEPWKSRALSHIRRQVAAVDLFIAVSHYEAQFMSAYLEIPSTRIRVVPLGVALDGCDPSPRPAADPARIGFLGRIAPEKGLHLLAKAFRILRLERSIPCRLDAAGYLPPEHRPYLQSIKSTLREAGLDAQFHYHGELDREAKLRFLQSLDVFSMPCAYDEPKGLPLLEAMANAVPVVEPRRGGLTEIVEASGGGLLVEPDSPAALAAGLARLLTDPELRTALARRGAESVHRDWSLEAMARRTEQVFREVTQAP